MNARPVPQALTLAEAAIALRISVRGLHRLLARGLLRSKKVGRRRIILAADLERYMTHGGR